MRFCLFLLTLLLTPCLQAAFDPFACETDRTAFLPTTTQLDITPLLGGFENAQPLCHGFVLVSHDQRIALIDIANARIVEDWTLPDSVRFLSWAPTQRKLYFWLGGDSSTASVGYLDLTTENHGRLKVHTVKSRFPTFTISEFTATKNGQVLLLGRDNWTNSYHAQFIIDADSGVVRSRFDPAYNIDVSHTVYNVLLNRLYSTTFEIHPMQVIANDYDEAGFSLSNYGYNSERFTNGTGMFDVSEDGRLFAISTYNTPLEIYSAPAAAHPPTLLSSIPGFAGAGMVTFTRNGRYLLVAPPGCTTVSVYSTSTFTSQGSFANPGIACIPYIHNVDIRTPWQSLGSRLVFGRSGNSLTWHVLPTDIDDDNDGIPNASDTSPTSADNSVFSNAFASDDDLDGIPDATDNCAVVTNASQADTDSDGRGDACDTDADGNGIADAWEILHGYAGGTAAAHNDEDTDGRDTLAEFVDGTDPKSVDAGFDAVDTTDYYPLDANRFWTFGTSTSQVSSVTGDLARMTLPGGGWMDLKRTPAGLAQQNLYIPSIAVDPDTHAAISVKVTFSRPLLMLPAIAHPGDITRDSMSVTLDAGAYGAYAFSATIELNVESIINMPTPDGMRHAVCILRSLRLAGMVDDVYVDQKQAQRTCYAQGIGPVQMAEAAQPRDLWNGSSYRTVNPGTSLPPIALTQTGIAPPATGGSGGGGVLPASASFALMLLVWRRSRDLPRAK